MKEMRFCKNPECRKEFLSTRKNHNYCCTKCQQKEKVKTANAYWKKQREEYIKLAGESEYNPVPISTGTICMAIRDLKRGKPISVIEEMMNRRPGEITEKINELKAKGKYGYFERMAQGSQPLNQRSGIYKLSGIVNGIYRESAYQSNGAF